MYWHKTLDTLTKKSLRKTKLVYCVYCILRLYSQAQAIAAPGLMQPINILIMLGTNCPEKTLSRRLSAGGATFVEQQFIMAPTPTAMYTYSNWLSHKISKRWTFPQLQYPRADSLCFRAAFICLLIQKYRRILNITVLIRRSWRRKVASLHLHYQFCERAATLARFHPPIVLF